MHLVREFHIGLSTIGETQYRPFLIRFYVVIGYNFVMLILILNTNVQETTGGGTMDGVTTIRVSLNRDRVKRRVRGTKIRLYIDSEVDSG